MAIRCFVIDDEPLATDLLKEYIGRIPDLHLAGHSNSPTQAFRVLCQTPVDVLFLDIQMPRLSGFDLLRPLTYRPKVIFTTAFREYALESYEFDVLDFLVKPISFERFLQSIGKIYRFSLPAEQKEIIKTEEEYQYFRVNKEMVKLFLRDILWIEGLKDYVKIHTTQGYLVSYLRISYLEEKLPSDRFVRIHKSYIVAINHIQAAGTSYVKIDQAKIPVGRVFKGKLEAALKTN